MLPEILPAEIFAFLIVFARVGAIIMLIPALGERTVPTNIRLVLALVLSLVIALPVRSSLPELPGGPLHLFLLISGEILIGLFIGAAARFLMTALHVAGTVIAFQAGLSMAQAFNPTEGTQSAVMANFFNTTYLPRHRPQVEEVSTQRIAPEVPEAAQDLTGKGCILLVEDEDPVRTFASRALRNKGYTVLEAINGGAALDIVTGYEGDIDLLISDVVMPTMDGPTLMKRAREHRDGLKCILISGYAEDEFRQQMADEEFVFLPKPFSLKQLAGTVKDMMS